MLLNLAALDAQLDTVALIGCSMIIAIILGAILYFLFHQEDHVTTPGSIDPLSIRRRLDRHDWAAPVQFGPNGWLFDHLHENGRIIVTACDFEGDEWIHASIAWQDRAPLYAEFALMHQAVFPGYSYQVFPPEDQHINIHPNALHLWGRADGKAVMPEFGSYFGMI